MLIGQSMSTRLLIGQSMSTRLLIEQSMSTRTQIGQSRPMSTRLLSLVVGVILIFTVHDASGQSNTATYAIMAPSNLRGGGAYNITIVTLVTTSSPVTVNFSIVNPLSVLDVLASGSTVLPSAINGSTAQLSIQIPLAVPLFSYNLTVIGSGGLTFNKSNSVGVFVKTLSIFVQTDKALYKPGQIVLFRAIALFPNLHPYKDVMNVTIYDISSNKIVQWLNVKNATGVFTQSLQLSAQTALGTWQIEVIAQGNTIKKAFTVAQYVLPKFQVTVTLPTYFLVNVNNPLLQKPLPIVVTAMYTYGEPVIGHANVTVQMSIYTSSPSQTFDLELVNGTAQTTMDVSTLLRLATPQYRYTFSSLASQTFVVTAVVLETVTGTMLKGSATVPFSSTRNKLTFLSITPSNYKPGLLFIAYLQLSQPDQSAPLPEDVKDPLTGLYRNVTVTVKQSKYNTGSAYINVSVTDTGYMMVPLMIDPSTTYLYLTANYFETVTNQPITADTFVLKFNSRDAEGIQVTLSTSNGVIEPNTVVMFNVKTTKNVSMFTYEILGKGTITVSNTIKETAPTTDHSFHVFVSSSLAQLLAPSANVVVWCLSTKGEVISDSLQITVNATLTNQVSMSFNQAQVAPSQSINLTVNAYNGSYVGILAVDKSVLLLKSGNDLSSDLISQDLSGYSKSGSSSSGYQGLLPQIWWWPIYPGGTDTSSLLSYAGLFLQTDAEVYQEPYYYPDSEGLIRGPAGIIASPQGVEGQLGALGIEGAPGSAPAAPAGSSGTNKQPTQTRLLFLETWLWTDSETGSDGSVSLQAKVPDTITSWVASAFAVSDVMGLGLATSQLTVFQPFFISLNLPYSIIRGEEFALQVTVFNYLSVSVQVLVTLVQSNQFMIRLPNAIGLQSVTTTAAIEVASNNAGNAYFWIVAQSLGQVAINIKAQSPLAADAVIANLLVLPEGIPQSYSSSVFIQLPGNGSTFQTNLNVSLPPNGQLVPGSQTIQCTVIGDLMGPSIQGLDSLLQMPFGCGEQNMMNLAPDVYIMKYLDVSGLTTPAITAKALSYMLYGYQQELTYQRIDGSFSAFGDSDLSGSTWLSAFVAKVFHQAKGYIAVQDSKMATTLNWIALQQWSTGAFLEPGRILHTELQGGSSSGVSMTAYVVLSLYENRDNALISFNYNTVMANAVSYLESQLSTVSNDTYALSIVTYALTVVGSSQAANALQALSNLAITQDGKTHWEKPVVQSPKINYGNLWICPVNQAPSVNIEMTAYALLTYIKVYGVMNSWPIAKWLVAQRNSYGGFASTQDTVMALEALSSFAALLSGGGLSNTSNSVNVSVSSEGAQSQFQTIDPTTALLYQTIQLPLTSTYVNITATGKGIALVQLNVNYNVYATSSKPGINLTLVTQTNGDLITLQSCGSWADTSTVSGMVILQIKQLTGYTATNLDSISGQTNGAVQRIDNDGTNIILYIDQLTNTSMCINVTSQKTLMVDNVQSSPVSLYRYYDTKDTKTLLYQPMALSPTSQTSFCQTCPACCICDNTTMFKCQDGSCVNNTVVCNGVSDCSDGSDELNCPVPTTVASSQGSSSSSSIISVAGSSSIPTSQAPITPSHSSSTTSPVEASSSSSSTSTSPSSSTSTSPSSSTSTSPSSSTSTSPSSSTSTSTSGSTSTSPSSSTSTFGASGTSQSQFTEFLWTCSFELSDGSSTLCGLTQDTTDVFDWTVWSGQTPSGLIGGMTGPDKAFNGNFYLYIEASKPRVLGDTAKILIPKLQQNGSLCLMYDYSMNGFHMGSLQVYSKLNNVVTTLWTQSGNHFDIWIEGRLTIIDNQYDTQIGFLGIVGNAYSGDISLDNIRVSSGSCP